MQALRPAGLGLPTRFAFPRLSSQLQSGSTVALDHISPSTVAHLRRHGYAYQDGILSSDHAAVLLHEFQHLIDRKLATPNKTHILRRSSPTSSPTTTTYVKRAVIQAETSALQEPITQSPCLLALQADSSLLALLNVHWPRLTLHQQDVKVQRASGLHGCFPIHIDSAADHDARILTALLYPHHEWPYQDGALRIYTSPISHVDLLPRPGRLVLFSSRLMHHRVLPAQHNRFAITLWLSGTIRRPNPTTPHLQSLQARVAYQLLQPRFRDMAFRLALETQWEASLRESHHSDDALTLIEGYRQNLALIRDRAPPVLCAELGLESREDRTIVQNIVQSEGTVRDAFEQLDRTCGQVPFVW